MEAQVMNKPEEYILVAAPTKAGEQFVLLLKLRGVPFAVITNNKEEQQLLYKLGVEHVILLDTTEQETLVIPEYRIGKVFIFEKNLTLSCRFLQISRKWTSRPVYIISEGDSPRSIYKKLGADFVIHSKTGNVMFLVD